MAKFYELIRILFCFVSQRRANSRINKICKNKSNIVKQTCAMYG